MAGSKFDVVAVGEINADLIVSGDVEPVFGQVEKLVDDARLVIGSSAAIFACGAARLGLKTAIVGKIGADQFGRFMIDALEQRGIDTSAVVVDPDLPTGLSVILSKGSDRAILTAPGTIPALRYSDIDLSLVQTARHLHLASYYLLDALRPDIPRLFRDARETGATVSLDTNYDPAETWNGGVREALHHVDVFLPNTTEFTGITERQNLEAADKNSGPHLPLTVVKMGEMGARAKAPGAPSIAVTAPSIDVADAVGAGDSFDAGFVYGFVHDWDLRRSVQLGIACGSLSACKPGGTDGQPDLETAMRFIENAEW